MPSGMELAIKALAAAQAGKQRLQSLDPDVKQPEGPVTMENIPQNAEYINQRMARNVAPQGRVQFQNPLAKALYYGARKRLMSLYPQLVEILEKDPRSVKVNAQFSPTFDAYYEHLGREAHLFPTKIPKPEGGMFKGNPPNPFAVAAHEIFGHGIPDLTIDQVKNWERAFPGLRWKQPLTGNENPRELLSTWIERKFPPYLSNYGVPELKEPYSFYNYLDYVLDKVRKGNAR